MKTKITENHMTLMEDYVSVWVDSFIADRKAQRLSDHTIRFYTNNLRIITEYFDSISVKQISQITPQVIRDFLLYLEQVRKNTSGGVAVYYRTLRVFLNWYWEELEIETPNPMNKVKMPKHEKPELDAVTKEQMDMLLWACGDRDNFLSCRDYAILQTLFNTGVRASELCGIKLEHIDLDGGEILIEHGKGDKPRPVFFEKDTRRAIRRYLKYQRSKTWLFCNQSGEKLTYNALRQIMRRLSNRCNIPEISLHSFRRGFASQQLAKGQDILTLSRYLGHADTSLLVRYAKQDKQDLKNKYIGND